MRSDSTRHPELSHNMRHRRSSYAKQLRKHLLRQWQEVAVNSIVDVEQPRAMRASTECSALQAATCWNCAKITLLWVWTVCLMAALRLRAEINRAGEICNEVPATRTTAVIGEGKGPSAGRMPTAPSFPMTAVATGCPFGMSSMNEIVPLRGK